MQEDFSMEKKGNRSLQTSKGALEKKGQDAPPGKPYPKCARKRETLGPKSEPARKAAQNVNRKNTDGRDRGVSRQKATRNRDLAEYECDYYTGGGKKRNLTHLLNFQISPRDTANYFPQRPLTKPVIHNTIRSLMSTQKHKYNKEQFLQANCQFVVRADHDYSVYMADPDILVDWTLIEQIRVPSTEPLNCPICLYSPTVGKITRCGHVYCWSCILHYLALTDKSWHKCPICFEAIHRKDLKSVITSNQIQYQIGDEIVFQLMRRERGSTISVPVVDVPSRNIKSLLSVSETTHTTVYSKLLLADKSNVLDIVEHEEAELNKQLKENIGCPELCFVEEAMVFLRERKNQLCENRDVAGCSTDIQKISSSCKNLSLNEHQPNTDNILTDNDASIKIPTSPLDLFSTEQDNQDISCISSLGVSEIPHIREDCDSDSSESPLSRRRTESSSSSSANEMLSTVTAEDIEIINRSNVAHPNDYYFYQAMDGQQIFLHSINARMLESEYGSLEKSPTILNAAILEIESGSMTDELRKRLRYLQHLPITCQFQVVEIDLRPVVSAATVEKFKDQLDKRSRQRYMKVVEEKKFARKVEKITNRQMGKLHSDRIPLLDSRRHFPECGAVTPPDHSPNRSSTSSRASSPRSVSRRSISPPVGTMNAISLNNTFAQKLQSSEKNHGWKKRDVPQESEAPQPSRSGPLLSDAIKAALLQAAQEKESNKQDSGRHKKKGKRKTLWRSLAVDKYEN